jgi:prepilin-type N-terminal cleavage/methylation domain-containing protein
VSIRTIDEMTVLDRPRHRRDGGFTLVEILVAIVLVGIVTAVVVIGVSSLSSKGSDAACRSSLDAARTAAVAHWASTGSQPTTFSDMVSSKTLALPAGVTIDGAGRQLTGNGWLLMMSATSPPTFSCGGYSAAVLADAPIGYWRLDEVAGLSAADLGSASAAGVRATAPQMSAGAVSDGSATLFVSSTPQGITVPVAAGSPLDLSTAFSVEAWISPSIAGQNGGIVEKTVGGTVNTQFTLFLEGGQLVWRTRASGSPYVNTYTGFSPPAGQWTHVVGTYDGSSIRVYANGALIGAPTAAPATATGVGPLLIGQLGAGAPNYPFRGAIDEVAVYGTALSATRVLDHYLAANTV